MPRLETKVPEYNLLGAFWKNLREDIMGHGIVQGPSYTRYQQQRILKADAFVFIHTQDFNQWAEVSCADPAALREDLLHAYLNS